MLQVGCSVLVFISSSFKVLTDKCFAKNFTQSNLRYFSSPICFCFPINSLVEAAVSVEGESLPSFRDL